MIKDGVQQGKPSKPGIYAARQWYAWRILEWHEGAWWHVGRQATWPKNAEIEAFVGPLPVVSKDYMKPPLGTVKALEIEDWEEQFPDAPTPAGQVFDL